MKVSGSNLIVNGVEGWYKTVLGAESELEESDCCDRGIANVGSGALETTRVALSVVEPLSSVAVKPMATVTVSSTIFLSEGSPCNVYEGPSS